MPVVLALHYSQANNGVVHLAEGLVIPLIGAGFYQRRNVHQMESWNLDIEVSSVRIILLFSHGVEDGLIQVQEMRRTFASPSELSRNNSMMRGGVGTMI